MKARTNCHDNGELVIISRRKGFAVNRDEKRGHLGNLAGTKVINDRKLCQLLTELKMIEQLMKGETVPTLYTVGGQPKSQFKLGDVVYLKSGSPGLTVLLIEKDGISVGWFTEGTYEETKFPILALMKPETENGPATDHEGQ